MYAISVRRRPAARARRRGEGVNRNHLKIIACLSMLCDHAGLLLFPQVAALRWIGRLAMPLFAFFIGEGCLHTSNRKEYLLSLLGLGAGCQLVYLLEELFARGRLTAASDCWYFNILFSFSMAAALCFLMIDAQAQFRSRAPGRARAAALFGAGCAAAVGLTVGAWLLRRRGWSLYFDYGLCAVFLPMSAAAFRGRAAKLCAFSAALLAYCLIYRGETPFVWFALLCIPLLLAYNGEAGSKKGKYLFYVFYPAHLGALYLLALWLR